MKGKNREKKLYINTVIIFLSKFFTQFLSLLLLPLLTAKLTTSEYGYYDLICTYGWLVAVFFIIQLDNAIFRFLIDSRDDLNESKKIISNGIISSFRTFVIASILYFIITILFKVNYLEYIYIYAISVFVFSLCQQICRGFGDNVAYAISSVIVGVVNIGLCFVFIYGFNIRLEGMIIAYIIAYFAGSIYLFFRKKIYKYINIKLYDKDLSKKMVKYALPLVPNSITSWILNLSDKTMLSIFISTSATGIYSIATKFPLLISHVYSVFNLSWTESASLSANDEDKSEYFSKQIDNIFKICISICLIAMSAMAIIFRIMIDDSYHEAYNYVPILIYASIFEILSGLLGAIYISMKKSKNIAISTVIAAAINIIINLIFMKKFGIVVACISTLVSYIFLAIYRYFDVNKSVKLKFLDKKYIFILIYLGIITYFYYYNTVVESLILTALSIMVSYLINKEFIKIAFSKVKNKLKSKRQAKES